MCAAGQSSQDEKLTLWSWQRGAEGEKRTPLSYVQYSYHHLDEHGAGMTSFASHLLAARHAALLGEDKVIWKKTHF